MFIGNIPTSIVATPVDIKEMIPRITSGLFPYWFSKGEIMEKLNRPYIIVERLKILPNGDFSTPKRLTTCL